MSAPPATPPAPIALVLAGDRFVPGAIPLTDRGFRYGMSYFETLALHRGRTLFLTEHLSRLQRASAPFRPPETWRAAAATLLREPPIPDGVARLYITAGDGSPSDPATEPRVAALLECIPPITKPQSPITLTAANFTPLPLETVKTANYWPHILAQQTARAAGSDDAILVRPDGRIISGSMSNVFFLCGNELLTPSLIDGPRDGVIRAWVMRNFPTTEATLTFDDLPSFTAAFLTNSRIGIQEATRINEHPYPPSTLIADIAATYHREVLDAH